MNRFFKYSGIILICLLASSLQLYAQEGSFFSETTGLSVDKSALSIGGKAISQIRYFIDNENPESSEIESFPEVRLDFDYDNENSSMTAKLIFSRDKIYSDIEDIIDEAYTTVYFSNFNIETGFMKVVWGKGDELKALDILNPIDYTDFYNKTLLERKKAALMVKLNKYTGLNSLLELVYIPVYTGVQFDSAGDRRWAPYSVRQLAAFTAAGGTVSEEDTDTVEYSQVAARFTSTFSGFDYGFLYSYGFTPLPAAVVETPALIEVKPQRAHIFGAEAAKVLFGLNARAEAGYFLTEDTEGNDSDVKNNLLIWIAGFDKDLPLSQLNFLAETQGTYILSNSGLKSGDVDYSESGNYSQNIIILRLKDSWAHEKIQPQISATVHIEEGDFMLKPSVALIPKDDVKFEFLCTLFEGDEDTVFGVYDDNDFIQAKFTFAF